MGVRPAASIGKKWNAAYVESLDDAQTAYVDKLPEAAKELKAFSRDGPKVAKYAAAVNSNKYRNAVDTAFTEQKAGAAYTQRTDQIKVTGTTLFQQQKMVDMTVVRRAIRNSLGAVVELIKAADDVMQFKFDYADELKRSVTNAAAMSIADKLTNDFTAAAIFTQMKTAYALDKANSPWNNFKDV